MRQVKYGVPQGSILGPTVFDIYAHDLIDHTNSSSIHFADGSTFYRKCKAKQLLICADELTNDLISIEKWLEDSNLIFNAGKTKSMLFSTQEMSKYHNLHEKLAFTIYNSGKALERTHSTKLLGVIIHDHLMERSCKRVKSSYSTLRALKHLERLAEFKLRKNLAESLILSEIDHVITIYSNNLPKFLSKRIQKLMNSCAGCVLNKYAKESDLISLKWLPFEERVFFSSYKFAFNLFYETSKQNYLSLQFKKSKREPRSNHNCQFTIEAGMHDKDFATIMSSKFNELPLHIRQITERKRFIDPLRTHLLHKRKKNIIFDFLPLHLLMCRSNSAFFPCFDSNSCINFFNST